MQWGAVADIGYAARHGADIRATTSGWGSISRAVAWEALSSTLQYPSLQLSAVVPADWSRVTSGGELPALLLSVQHNAMSCNDVNVAFDVLG